jgi:precorrin-2 dehydrogenase/sirohydrochlorin ferrochelatase
MLSLTGKKCLVAGAGTIAERKTRRLLAEGADVSVVSPRTSGYFIRNRKIKLIKRKFKVADLKGKFLVIAATDDKNLNGRICGLAVKKNMLANSVSGRENTNFMNMVFVKKKGMVAAVSSNGKDIKKSLGIAEKIRKKIL